MLDFLDVFEGVRSRRRRRGAALALGRMIGFAFLALFFMLTIFVLW